LTPGRLLSIVIVSFNTRELLRRCLASIVENPHHLVIGAPTLEARCPEPHISSSECESHPRLPLELIVVDNDSADGSPEMVEHCFPSVRLVRSGSNLGFARATNLGLKESKGDLILLLNPDTEVVGGALAQMVSFLENHPEVGVVGPSLIYPDGRPQHAAFRFPNLWMSFFDFFPLNHRLYDSSLNGRYRSPRDGMPFPVDHPLGAAMMIRREALDEVGLLDESFFMYCEEIDWCLRARKLGWKVYQLPLARIIHHSAQSTSQFRDAMLVELHRSRYRFFRKHYSPAFISAHRAITRLGLAREISRALWLWARGQLSSDELHRRLSAFRAIWEM